MKKIRITLALVAAASLCLLGTAVQANAQIAPTISLNADKAVYAPGDLVNFTANTAGATGMKLALQYFSLNAVLKRQTVSVESDGTTSFSWQPPANDYTGYLLQANLLKGKTVVAGATFGIDVSSDWGKYPRYGFLSDFSSRNQADQAAIIAKLGRLHINGLQFYDWQDRHDQPLTLVDGSPVSQWQDIAGRPTYLATVNNYITSAHASGIKAMNYNLIMGAYDNYASLGISPTWGVYTDQAHQNQAGWPLPSSWESGLQLFDPNNVDWQNYIIGQEQIVASKLPFDGWHVDQLGSSDVYDYNGNSVDLAAGYASLLSKAKTTLGQDLVMNAVDDYGQAEIAGSKSTKFAYEELWANNSTFSDILNLVETNWRSASGRQNTVLAAYVNRGISASSGRFNPPGVLLADAAIFAAGGSHLEMGEHMLSNEYFPNSNLSTSSALNKSLTTYYDFSVAYENLLRGEVTSTSVPLTVKGHKMALGRVVEPGSLWSFARRTADKKTTVIHLLNLERSATDNWRDDDATQKSPKSLSKLTVKFKMATKVNKVWAASPDANGGAPVSLKFSQSKGFVTLTLPSLTYWSMLVAQ